MRDKFKLVVHESTGQKYEDLFVKIMGYSDSSFKPVKAHGNIGDRGNDGWCTLSGKYYQVYAPEDLPQNNDASIKKMKEDFIKLKNYWEKISPIKEYHFVVNDKYKGVSPHIYTAISEIKNENNLSSAEVILAQQLESTLFSMNADIINSVIGASSSTDGQSIYQYLVEQISQKMYLQYWPQNSENLISNSIESAIVDGFSEAIVIIFKTSLPNTIPSLESSIQKLSERAEILVNHFIKSPYTCLSQDHKWWQRDMSWKKHWFDDQDEYHEKYELYDNWRKQLYSIHCNLVFALNNFSNEVRLHVNPTYFMGQQFTVVDSMGTYNLLEGYEAIPDSYREVN